MMWKKVVLAASIVLVIILTIISVKPSGVQVTEFSEKADIRATESTEIPFLKSFPMNGFAVSGSWEGPGFAQVWLEGENHNYLVMDTRTLPKVIELSGLGSGFEAACIDSCKFPEFTPDNLVLLVSGPGVISIDAYHFAVPSTATGLSFCADCKKVDQPETPNHSLLALVFLLLIAVVGSHVLGHICRTPQTKSTALIIFLCSFVALGVVFGVSVAAPTTAIAVTTEKAASVFAAFGMLLLTVIGAIEVLSGKNENPPMPNVWNDLEDAEEEWQKK